VERNGKPLERLDAADVIAHEEACGRAWFECPPQPIQCRKNGNNDSTLMKTLRNDDVTLNLLAVTYGDELFG
jgi:hypothetical protein